MAAVTICSDFRAQEEEISYSFHFSPFYLPWCHDLSFFLTFSFKLALSFSSFTFIKRLFSSSLLSSIRVVSSSCCHPEFVAISSAILIPACNPSSPAYLMLCSAYTLNKQGDSREHCCTPFSILNQPIVPYSVLTVASWSTYRLLRRQVDGLVFPSL